MSQYDPFPQPDAQVKTKTPHSVLGIISFVMALLFGLAFFLVIAAIVFLAAVNPGLDLDGESPAIMFIGLLVVGCIGMELCALTLGILAVVLPGTKKLFGILGMVGSSGVLALILGVIAFGIIAG